MLGRTVFTGDDTREALLSALGFEVSSEAAVERELERRETLRQLRVIDPAVVAKQGSRDPQRHAVYPGSCAKADEKLGGRRAFGIWANLYTVRSDRNLGVGDLTDLAALAEWASSLGADFVGINPLHSTRNRGGQISPYCPVSRVYGNEVYLDVAAVPEFERSEAARTIVAAAEASGELQALRAASHVEYERVVSLKHSALRQMHATLRHAGDPAGAGRRREFAAYKRREGQGLVAYATFRALEEHFLQLGIPADWRQWSEEYRRPDTQTVKEFRLANEREVDFHCYMQFELDRQLCAVASRARSQMSVGLYGDLALGSDISGADGWVYQDVLVPGARIGAPPDDFAVEGQDWGLPPVSPEALRESGYEYWIALLRANLRHAGALRLDHVMGLFRQYWIPEALPASRGAYVRFPANDLLGILALESNRNDAIVVGEDLGTVPRGFQAMLARWGVLSSRVVYFERNRKGAFKSHRSYSKRAMVTANTHDLAPLAGYWKGRDLELRRDAGCYESQESYESAMRQRREEQGRLRERVKKEGLLPGESMGEESAASLARSAYTFLAKTPAPLVGVSLDDLALEEEPVNLPGVGNDRFPSWSRKMSRSVEELTADRTATEILRAVQEARQSRSQVRGTI